MIDPESIERATFAAVPPEAHEEFAGWLLAYDHGTVSRARSAAALRHAAPDRELVDAIEARYRAHGLPAMFRLPVVPCFSGLRDSLVARSYERAKPTLLQTAAISELQLPAQTQAVALARAADDAWIAVFLGEGFDPLDGASRVGILRRGRESVYAQVVIDGAAAAVGVGCFSQRWCGIHAMRTAPAFRGRGLAGAIVAALAREAASRGIRRAFLQVEENNAAAQSLYARLGFRTAWGYEYWRQPAS